MLEVDTISLSILPGFIGSEVAPSGCGAFS